MYGQSKKITGTVISKSDNLPLPGVNVIIKGKKAGTTTDFDGFYEVNANIGDVLVFSSFLTLQEDISELDEVVVVGYQKQSKREISGAISQVKSDVLERQAFTNFGEALQGQLAGVNIQAQSGAPGSRVNIQIRGANSLASTGTQGLDPLAGEVDPSNASLGPLYIVDGVPFSDYPNISANEIESIEVLKDAATAAIYGSRASGGVIIITTKRAKAGPIRVNLSTFTSINRITSSVPTLTGPEYIGLDAIFIENSGLSFEASGVLNRNPDALNNNTQWQDIILNDNAITKNYNARLSGGADNANFSLVLDHLDQEGVFINSDLKRTNARLNANFKKGKFTLFTSLFFSRSDANREPWALLYDAIKAPATEQAPQNAFELEGNLDQFNVLGNIPQKLSQISIGEINTGGASFQFGYEVFDGLRARFNLSGNRTQTRNIFFQPGFRFLDDDGNLLVGREEQAIAKLQEGTTTFQQTSVETILDYNKKIGKHKLTLLTGYTLEQRLWATTRINVREFETNNLPTVDQAIDRENINVSGNDTDSAIIGIIGTVGWSYDGKYAIRANVRRDSSSKFFGDNQSGWFGGISGAWTLSSEKFFENIGALSFISNLKFRASYGEVGNQNIGDFRTLPLITNNLNVPLGLLNEVRNGLNQTEIFNKDLKWETSISKNFGVDLGLLNGAFTLSAEYYEVEKEDLLFNVVLPPSSGGDPSQGNLAVVPSNIGSLTNKGFEITAGYKGSIGKVRYNLNGTFTQNENKVTRLNGAASQIPGDRITPGNNSLTALPVNFAREGFQAGAFFLVPTDGIIRTQEELVDYKNFDFSMSWFGSYGSKIFNGPKALAYDARNHRDLLFSYTSTNQNSNIPILREGVSETSLSPITDLFLEDGDYIRLRNIQIGYSLPNEMLKDIGISKFRIYLGGSNILTITDYTGYDPEVGGDGLFSRGLDRGLTPITASGRIGVEIGF